MKRMNFERVKELIKMIEDRESLLEEIRGVTSYTGDVSVHVRNGKIDVYIPTRYGHIGQEYLHKIVNIVKAEIAEYTKELEAL